MRLVTSRVLRSWCWKRDKVATWKEREILDYELRVIHGVLVKDGYMLSDISIVDLKEDYLFDLLDVLHKNLTKQVSVDKS